MHPKRTCKLGDGIDRDLEALGGSTLRRGAVALQGINVEKWLFTMKTELGIRDTECLPDVNSITSGAKSPIHTLYIHSCPPNAFMEERVQEISMSESDAVALWDFVDRNFRTRQKGSGSYKKGFLEQESMVHGHH